MRLPRPHADIAARAGQALDAYLRDAQAYMLISMPTCTSTIFGVFQLIRSSQMAWREVHAEVEPMASSHVAQVDKIDLQAHLRRS
jgi:hypothetical protein